MQRVMRYAVMVGIPALAACYSYRAVPVDAALVGATVRARISAAEAERLGREIGRESRLLEGPLLEKRENEILLAIATRAVADAVATAGTYQRVGVPRGAILELETRRFDRLKTGAVTALAVAVAGFVAVKAFGGDGAPGGAGKGGADQMVARP